MVGLEPGEVIWVRNASGVAQKGVIDTFVVQHSAVVDQDSLTFLTGHGYIAPLPSSKVPFVKSQPPPFYIPIGKFAGSGTVAHLDYFEWVLNHEKGALLNNFSIGPTMMYLAFSGEAAKAGASPTGIADARWPQTWDDIFNLYVAATEDRPNKYLSYLDKSQTKLPYPSEAPNNQQATINWLVKQVGNPTTAAAYYPRYKQFLDITLKALGV
jgi:hypothetical protein